jgi:hypothetical protein
MPAVQPIPWMILAMVAALIAQDARAQPDPFCAIRNARSDAAWAVAAVRAEATADNAFGGRGDHCDEQQVVGTVLRVLKGPLKAGATLRFVLSQGACGVADSINDEFVEPGAELVVLLRRTSTGEVYQTRAESPAAYEAKERACGR